VEGTQVGNQRILPNTFSLKKKSLEPKASRYSFLRGKINHYAYYPILERKKERKDLGAIRPSEFSKPAL